MAGGKIVWTDKTWNPVRGCSKVSAGCKHCYAMGMAARFSKPGMWGHGFAEMRNGKPRWTGKVDLIPEKLAEPLSWRQPRRVFVNSTSDLFHEELSFGKIAAVFGVMSLTPHIEYQALTKRPARALMFFRWLGGLRGSDGSVADADSWMGAVMAAARLCPPEASRRLNELYNRAHNEEWPLLNVSIGISAENQPTWDERVLLLAQIPAARRFVSYEPALGPIVPCRCVVPGADLLRCSLEQNRVDKCDCWCHVAPPDVIIFGTESGRGARVSPFCEAEIEWARRMRDWCKAAGVSFFRKQLTETRGTWGRGRNAVSGGSQNSRGDVMSALALPRQGAPPCRNASK